MLMTVDEFADYAQSNTTEYGYGCGAGVCPGTHWGSSFICRPGIHWGNGYGGVDGWGDGYGIGSGCGRDDEVGFGYGFGNWSGGH